jgi:hypothetical protein
MQLGLAHNERNSIEDTKRVVEQLRKNGTVDNLHSQVCMLVLLLLLLLLSQGCCNPSACYVIVSVRLTSLRIYYAGSEGII